MLTKKQVLSVVRNMPDNFDTTRLFDRILMVEKIIEGHQQIREGKGLSALAAKQQLKVRLRKRGK